MAEPKLSFVLGTDSYATIAPVIERLRRQTVRDQVELVLVAPPGAVDEALAFRDEFAGIQIVEHPVTELETARAAGVHAASAEWVFIGETHSYPHSEFAECLIRRSSDSCSVITPAIGNANPDGVWSWASLLFDYGQWVEGRPGGELHTFPSHNSAYRRGVLQALGDHLAPSFRIGGEMCRMIRDAGHRAQFEPAARIDHVNLNSPSLWASERFAGGVAVAGDRLRGWSFARRVLYLVASPLIPVVLCRRVLPHAWRTVRAQRLPPSTLFYIVAGAILRAGGEFLAYTGVPNKTFQQRMVNYEMHKLAFVQGRVS